MISRISSYILLAAAIGAVFVYCAPAGFHVADRIQVGGEGGWDYLTVDDGAHRLYVSHSTHVAVIDLNTNEVVGDIPNTRGVHGVAVVPEYNRGYTSNGGANDVTIFDLKTLKEIGHTATGQNPDSIRYDPVSGRVFTFNGSSHDSTVIDARTGEAEDTIPLGGKPEFSVIDGRGKLYVNIEDTSELVEIDTGSLEVTKRYSLAPCEEPTGLAFDGAERHLFSVCSNRIMVISDPDAGKILATVPTGAGTDGAGYDPGLGLAFSSNGGDGTLTVVGQVNGKCEALETVPTQRGARTMVVDPATHKVYLSAADPGTPDSFHVLVVSQ